MKRILLKLKDKEHKKLKEAKRKKSAKLNKELTWETFFMEWAQWNKNST